MQEYKIKTKDGHLRSIETICAKCEHSWFCQCTDKNRVEMQCFKNLMKKYGMGDGVKIVMFY
jgi:hypothetical protein